MKASLASGALTALIFVSSAALAAPPKSAPAKPAAPKAAPAAKAAKRPHGKTASRGKVAPDRVTDERSAAKTVTPAARPAKEKVKPPCFHDPVTVVHFAEQDTFPLTKCDGSVAHLAVERLSVLARPGSAPKPQSDPADLSSVKGNTLSKGIRRVDPVLVQRIQTIVDHFSKGKHARLQLVSGYRPASSGSYHATGRALDMRLEGVSNEALIAFCKSLPDTGCGYYPNSSFIHIDVREPGTGHVAWIDASGPGESPRYVAAWPPPAPASGSPSSPTNTPPPEDSAPVRTVEDALAKLDKILPPLPADEHGASDRNRAADEADAKAEAQSDLAANPEPDFFPAPPPSAKKIGGAAAR